VRAGDLDCARKRRAAPQSWQEMSSMKSKEYLIPPLSRLKKCQTGAKALGLSRSAMYRRRKNTDWNEATVYERRISSSRWLAGLPGSLIALILLWTGIFLRGVLDAGLSHVLSGWDRLFAGVPGCLLPATLSNLLAALREEDFSLRARGARSETHGEVDH